MNIFRTFIVVVFAIFTGPVHAGGFTNQDVSRYWQKHEQVERELFTAFRTGAPVSDYSQPMLSLVRYETQLVLTGLVRSDDPRLVASLAKSGDGFTVQSGYDNPIFTYRVFAYEFARQSGYTPNPAELFNWSDIRVQR